MAAGGYTRIVTDGLIFSVDAYNVKSYIGSGTVVNDLTDNGNNGALINGISFDTPYWIFDGISDNINIDSVISEVSGTTVGSLDIWVKPDLSDPVDAEYLISFSNGAVSQMNIFYDSDSFLYFRIVNSGTVYEVKSDSPIMSIDDTILNITVVQDGAGPILYLDGQLISQTVNVSTDAANWFNNYVFTDARIGSRRIGAVDFDYFDGGISITKIYNRALLAAEVKQNYNATKWRFK